MSAGPPLAAVASEGIADLLLEFGLVLFALGILGGLSRRLGVSPVPLYLLAGLALGEGEVVGRGLNRFPAGRRSLGLILLLLTLGLEFSAEEFSSVLRRHVPFGRCRIRAPMPCRVQMSLLSAFNAFGVEVDRAVGGTERRW